MHDPCLASLITTGLQQQQTSATLTAKACSKEPQHVHDHCCKIYTIFSNKAETYTAHNACDKYSSAMCTHSCTTHQMFYFLDLRCSQSF